MPAVTDIVNKSLRLIGASRITSLTDGSTNANAANDIYEETRDDLLRSHPWNFATKRAQLAQSATTPTFEFDYAYPLPSDWIRTVSVHDNDAAYGTIFYREELNGTQRAILANSSSVYLRYVYRASDPNHMAADFRAALASALARDLSLILASSNTIYDSMSVRAARDLSRARSTDALGSTPELRPRGSWAISRGGNRKNEYFSD